MSIKITVTDPASGKSVTWEAMSRASALNQARIEADKGAKVVVKDGNRTVFKN